MTALYIGARVPVVDPRTGIANPIWYRFLSSLFSTAGDGAVSDTNSFEIAPTAENSALDAIHQISSTVDFQQPAASPQYFLSADDVLPLISSLRDEIAMLRSQLNDIQQGVAP